MSGTGSTARPRLAIIVAVADNGVIGRDNDLPWRLRDDLRRFKALTTGHTVIMGRRTYESIGRPLPDRRNIVLSRNADFAPAGVEVFQDLDSALAAAASEARVFVLGGRGVFAEALPHTDVLHLTRVHAEVDGDVYFPELELAAWVLEHSERHPADEHNEHPFSFADYRRR